MPQTTPPFGPAGVTRNWTDANGNFEADCNLLSPDAQDLRASGGDVCGVLSNVSFGTNVPTNTFDASLLSGWGVRPSDWNLAVSFQQQIGKRFQWTSPIADARFEASRSPTTCRWNRPT